MNNICSLFIHLAIQWYCANGLIVQLLTHLLLLLAMLTCKQRLCSRVKASFAYQLKANAVSPESGIAKSVRRKLLFYLVVVSSTLER